jgi:hypothetical protein
VLEIVHIADLLVQVGPPVDAGETMLGRRRIVPILGGDVRGDHLNGEILPGGADCQLLRHDGVTELEARYAIATDSGARIYVVNKGLRHGTSEVMARLNRGEFVNPSEIYFRTTPRFETADENYAWLTRHVFTASGARYPERIDIAIYQVM